MINDEDGWRPASETSTTDRELLDKRSAIDHFDEQIAALLNNRMLLAREIGLLKAGSGQAVKDLQREQQVIEHVSAAGADPAISRAIAATYYTLLQCHCQLSSITETNSAPTRLTAKVATNLTT